MFRDRIKRNHVAGVVASHCRGLLLEDMRRPGFEALLPDGLQAPIIVTFPMPADPRFGFGVIYA